MNNRLLAGYKRGLIVALVLAIMIFDASYAARAESFKIGVEDSSYLPHFGVTNGEFTGYARDLLDAFANDAGHKFEYVELPVKRLMLHLSANQIDFRYPDNPNWYAAAKSKLIVRYSRPVAISTAGVSVLPDRAGSRQLNTMGILLGFNPVEYQAQIESGSLKLGETSTMDSLVKMGMQRRVDGIYGDVHVVQHHLRRMGYSAGELVFDYSLPYSLHPFSVSTIRYPGVLASFDQWLASQGDLVTRLKAKHDIHDN